MNNKFLSLESQKNEQQRYAHLFPALHVCTAGGGVVDRFFPPLFHADTHCKDGGSNGG